MLSKNVARSAATARIGQVARRSLFGFLQSNSAPLVAPDVEYPEVPATSPAPLPAGDSASATSQNGVTVAASSRGRGIAHVTVAVGAGSRFTSYDTSGASHAFRNCLMQHTQERTSLRLWRELENLGATATSEHCRDFVKFHLHAPSEAAAPALELFLSGVFTPKLFPFDLPEHLERTAVQIDSSYSSDAYLVTDAAHAAAFGDDSPLGMPLHCSAADASRLTADALEQFAANVLSRGNVAVAASGVRDAQAFAAAIADELSSLPVGDAQLALPESAFSAGNDNRTRTDGSLTHFALAFAAAGSDSKDAASAAALAHILGGGDRVALRKPVHGTGSVLAGIFDSHAEAEAAHAQYHGHRGAGLLTLRGAAPRGASSDLAAALVDSLKAVAGGSVTAEQVSGAQAVLSVRAAACSDDAIQATSAAAQAHLKQGADATAEESAIAGVTADSIAKAAKAALEGGVSVAARGDLGGAPRASDVQARL